MAIVKQKSEYDAKKLITFGLTIKQKLNEKKEWKKVLETPKQWNTCTLKTGKITQEHNAIGMLTGKINKIFVIDIDDVDDWTMLLKKTNNEEPKTVKAISGNGGIHLYFQYSKKLDDITTKNEAIVFEDKPLKIDVRTNGGFIICPPSEYYHEGKKANVKYEWEYTICDYALLYLPDWLTNLFLQKQNKNGIMKIVSPVNDKALLSAECEHYEQSDFTDDDIKKLCSFLSNDRIDNYKLWIDIGMCLKNLSDKYLKIWTDVSKKSKKFDEKECHDKWKSFKITKKGFGIGSLIMWCKEDNKKKCDDLLKERNIKTFVDKNKDKFPNNDLEILDIKTSSDYHYITLNDKYCPIIEKEHKKKNMFLELTPYELVMKCNRCIGYKYPCEHIKPTLKDIKQLFNIKIDNLTINNYYGDSDENNDIEICYEKIFDDDNLNKLVFESVEKNTPSSFARIVYYHYKDKFNYGEDEKWYKFDKHKWIKIKSKNYNLRNAIEDTLYNDYSTVYKYYKEKEMQEIATKIKKTRNLFGDTTMKNNIYIELTELYFINNEGKFLENLDDNPKLIGFENGIYDLDKMKFRDGQPEDYVSMTTGYDFVEKHTDKIKNIKKFFKDIMPDKNNRKYLLLLCGSFLMGTNADEIYSIFTGGMRNGKSTLSNILMYVLGDYYGDVNNTLLTNDSPSADKPRPELLEIIKKRIIISSENAQKQKINTGFVKQITGNDRIKARSLYSNDIITFIPHFKLISLFNDIPDVDNPNDKAFWGRCKCLHFPVKFCDNPQGEFEKKIDKTLKQEIKLWKNDCFLYFLKYYKLYAKDGLIFTKQIMDVTKKFEKNNDPFVEFCDNYIETNEMSIVKWSDLKDSYTQWYRDNIGYNVPTIKMIKNYFETHVFKEKERVVSVSKEIIGRGWKGWKLLDVQ